MSANNNKSKGLVIGLVALAVGVAIGVAGTEVRRLSQNPRKTPDTNQISVTSVGVPNLFADTNQWDPFQEIQRMQAQMDQSFNDMFEQFRMQPQFIQPLNPNYSSSINVEDLKDRYVVRAYLPDAKASDVHVTLNDGRTLKVEVNNQQSEKSAQTNSVSQVSEWGQYEQTVQLPTPVKSNQMTVKHDGHDLIITIPKAS
ncbi:MAG TPA: Hsp20 family protein [Verrucomicrobiae bacterium]|nr:Hsp20 family protein [Verrucomicrobiae bacterium]